MSIVESAAYEPVGQLLLLRLRLLRLLRLHMNQWVELVLGAR